MELLLKYLTVVGLSMAKLVLGPITARGLGLSPVESVVLSATGMTATAAVIGFVGEAVRRRFEARFARSGEDGTKKEPDPRMKRVFDRYGIAGIAFLTPILLSPPGGALVATALGVPRGRMVVAMAVAGVLGAAVYTVAVYAFGDVLVARGLLDPLP